MEARTSASSLAVSTEVVLPNDTNALGNLMGGRLLHWMDVNTAIAAHRHCRSIVVTAAVNNVSFGTPIKLGSIVTLESKVSRAFNTSMEVFVDIFIEDYVNGGKIKHSEAIFTFVSLDQSGNTIKAPEVIPETDLEKKRHEGALRRRQLSQILGGRMKPGDATELKALFDA